MRCLAMSTPPTRCLCLFLSVQITVRALNYMLSHRLLCEYLDLCSMTFSYMDQVSGHVEKGLTKFVMARNRDSSLHLSSSRYSGREFRALVAVGKDGAVKRRAPGDSEDTEPTKCKENEAKVSKKEKGGGPNPISILRRRVLEKAAEKDPELKKRLEAKKKRDAEKRAAREKDAAASAAAAAKRRNAKLEEDPVLWFGVLVPREVRAAQKAFSSGVDKLARVASMRRRMREIEIKITALKRKLRAT